MQIAPDSDSFNTYFQVEKAQVVCTRLVNSSVHETARK